MQKKHRSRLGILLDILKSIQELDGASITTIITYANIPHDRLKKILSNLVLKGYVVGKKEKNRVIYFLSKKGYDLLRELERMRQILEGLGLIL